MLSEFAKLLSQKPSLHIVNDIVKTILDDKHRIQELMDCFFDDHLRMCQHAAWPLGKIAEKNPDIVNPYFAQMLTNLDSPKHDAVVRNTLRTFQYIILPEELQSEAYDRCLKYILDPKYPIAFSAFAMTVCANIAMQYPDLREEVIAAIDYRMPQGSAGIRSRGMKERNRLTGF